MTWGVYIKGDSGETQIDDTYHNLMLVASGFTASLGSVGAYEDVSYTGEAGCTPVIALACTSKATILQVTVSGNTWTWRIAIPYAVTPNGRFDYTNTGVSHAPASVAWYVFDKPRNDTPLTGWGLAVWDAAGKLVFDSNRKSMRVVGVLTMQSIDGFLPSATFPAPATFTGAAGRSYAVVFAGQRYRYHTCQQGGSLWQTAYVIDAASVNGTAVEMGDTATFFNLSGAGANNLQVFNGAAQSNLVLDVTGY